MSRAADLALSVAQSVAQSVALSVALSVGLSVAALAGCEHAPGGSGVLDPAAALGPRPTLGAATPFAPATPRELAGPNGLRIWLLERHELPLVAATLAGPVGSAADPAGAAGLAHVTASMLTEGAGARSALAFSDAVNDLGARVHTSVTSDASFASLEVLAPRFAAAFALFSDLVARPRFEPREFSRVHALWRNELSQRGDDAGLVAELVTHAAFFGPSTPYGHPPLGLRADAARVDLSAVKAFYAEAWRPDAATLVVVGDVTPEELQAIVRRGLATWQAPATTRRAPLAPSAARVGTRPRLVLIDRPQAPQSVVMIAHAGVRANEPAAVLVPLVNTVLGGSFTSRLNQSLREQHGWTYGATSSFEETRGRGLLIIDAEVFLEATAEAIAEVQHELATMARDGLQASELAKARAQDRASLVERAERGAPAAERLAELAALGLTADFDARASAQRQTIDAVALREAAASVERDTALVVVVGPLAKVSAQLATLGLGAPELWDVEGRPLTKKVLGAKP